MPPDTVAIQALLERLTLVSVLAWVVVAFMKGWIAPGSVVKELRGDVERWAARHDKLATIAEAVLRKASGA